MSPYGVTKLAAENLCRAYGDSYELPVVVLRYFSVYGPRQRPDMGYHKFIQALLENKPIVVYGDGQQARGNTYVADCVAATLAAAAAPPGEVYNVGGGEVASVWEIIHHLEAIAGRKFVDVRREPARAGDQRFTSADTRKLLQHCGWRARTSLAEGLVRQWEWQRERQWQWQRERQWQWQWQRQRQREWQRQRHRRRSDRRQHYRSGRRAPRPGIRGNRSHDPRVARSRPRRSHRDRPTRRRRRTPKTHEASGA